MKSGKTIVLDCGMLRIEWERGGDRWRHRVGLAVHQELRSLLQSVEGLADDLWPASPVLQEVHLETRGEDVVAFLTGMAGKNYWSASVLGERSQHRATFELACRFKDTPKWLGSVYQMPDVLGAEHATQVAVLSSRNDGVRLVARTDDRIGSVPGFETPSNNVDERESAAAFLNRLKTRGGTIVFSPQRLSDNKVRTVRWKYTFEARPA